MYLYLLTKVIYFGVVGVPLQGHRGNCCPHAATANFACQPSNYPGTRRDAKLLPTREVGARCYMVRYASAYELDFLLLCLLCLFCKRWNRACLLHGRDGRDGHHDDYLPSTYLGSSELSPDGCESQGRATFRPYLSSKAIRHAKRNVARNINSRIPITLPMHRTNA